MYKFKYNLFAFLFGLSLALSSGASPVFAGDPGCVKQPQATPTPAPSQRSESHRVMIDSDLAEEIINDN